MCLIKKYKYPRFTIFPKTVYKRLDEENGMLVTPCQRNLIRMGETHIAKPYYKNIIKKAINKESLDEGFIHCYKNYKYACEHGYFTEHIAKCRIPAFTIYFIGCYGEIATRKLKYIKMMKQI